MKLLLLLSFVSLFSFGIYSCKRKTFQIVYSSEQNDNPTEFTEDQVYKLTKQAVHADFNMIQLANLDSYRKDSTSLRAIFEPVNGNFNYYQFVSTFKGLGMLFPGDDPTDSIQLAHDILIVKTNDENIIVDAFQYTLEWSEYPFHYDLFRSTNTNIPLTDSMDINKFKFTRTEYWDKKDAFLAEKGIVRLK